MNVLVIGGSSGYGQGITQVLSKHHNVMTAQRTESREGTGWIQLDLNEPFSMDRAAKAIDDLQFDAVIYSAGIAIGKNNIVDGNLYDWFKVFKVNTLGLMWAIKHTMPTLTRNKGWFIHIGSIAYNINYAGAADYCASKAASSSIMKTLRREVLGTGVRTVSIEPGLGNTNFQATRYAGDMEKARKHYEGITQLEPVDLGNTVAWLLDQPKHVNIDELIIKPLDQVTHGLTIRNL